MLHIIFPVGHHFWVALDIIIRTPYDYRNKPWKQDLKTKLATAVKQTEFVWVKSDVTTVHDHIWTLQLMDNLNNMNTVPE